MTNQLKDHIDEPIKKCVVGLNLLGFKTLFSCCGFSYKNEAVPKSHLGKAYIYLDRSSFPTFYGFSPFKGEEVKKKAIFFDIALKSGWNFKKVNDTTIDFYGESWPANHPWGHEGSVHFYEQMVLSIRSLESALDLWQDSFADQVTIECAYKEWNKLMKYFNYEACESWTVTKEDYLKL